MENIEKCADCFFWQKQLLGEVGGHGFCQRYPPVARYDYKQPKTHGTDWCGEFKPMNPDEETT